MPFKRGDKVIFLWDNEEHDCEILEEVPYDCYVVIFPENSGYDYNNRVMEIASIYLKHISQKKEKKIIITI